jgi:hypothetical protein
LVKIECRDVLVYDADLASFQMGLSRFKGAKFTAGNTTAGQSKDGPYAVFHDPVVEVDESKSDPEDVKKYIEGSGVFRLRIKP